MDGAGQYSALFYAGAALMSASAAGGAATFFLRRRAGKRLREKLNAEYGKKRR